MKICLTKRTMRNSKNFVRDYIMEGKEKRTKKKSSIVTLELHEERKQERH